MTRIIAGQAKGQRIEVPTRGTRPTSDRVREACFSAIESWMNAHSLTWQEVQFIDLFGGSGAVGLEAASRGATAVTIVEKNAATSRVIASNAKRLGLHVSVATADAATWSPTHAHALVSTWIIYIDPPYDWEDLAMRTLIGKLSGFPEFEGALLVIERGIRSPSPLSELPPGVLGDSWDRTYGDTRIWYGHLVGGTS